MSAGPVVSVVIPTYGRPGLLRQAVASALAQTHGDLEILVLDDGSDPPVALTPDLADPRVRVVRNDRNQGWSRSVRRAVDLTTDELIAFLDDDDEWFPPKIERQVRVLAEAGDEVAGVRAGYEMWHEGRLHYLDIPDRRTDVPRRLLAHPCFPPSATMIRRAAFEEAGGLVPGLGRHWDWDLWLRITDRRRIEALPEVLALRRSHPPASPAIKLEDRRALLDRLEPRIAALSPAERGRVLAVHEIFMGGCLAALGRRSEARRLLLRALRRDPSAWRAGVQLARTFLGETIWQGASRVVRTVGHPVARAVGYEPRILRC